MKYKEHIVWHYPHLLLAMGGTIFIRETARVLTRKYSVTVICNAGSPAIIKSFEDAGIRVVTTSFLSTNSFLYWLLFPFAFAWDLGISSALFQKADYVVATLFPSNAIAGIYSVLFKKRFFYYCYEPYPFFHNKTFMASFTQPKRTALRVLAFLYGWLDKWTVRWAHKVFTLNEITKKFVKDVYHVDALVTYMGVDTAHFKPSPPLSNPLYKNRKLVVHATDYTTNKHTELAIQAVAAVREKHPDVLLVITSTRPGAPERRQYEELARTLKMGRHVHFAGLLPYADLPRLYSGSVCYLSTSYDETLGTTSSNLPVKEALACGTPALRAPVTQEDVEDGVSGFLVDPRDTELVAKRLSYLLSDPAKARSMGAKGRTKIVQLYTWSKVATVIENELRKK